MKKSPHFFNNEGAKISIICSEETIRQWQQQRQSELKARELPLEWAEIGVVFDDPNLLILRDLVEFPGGYRNGYIRLYNRAFLEHGAAGVVVLPVREEKILLIQHYRHATRSRHWEIPRGFGRPGVKAETQARNEVKEEVEGNIEKLIDLGILYNNTGLEGNPIHLFLAHLTSIGRMETEEAIETFRWVSVAELERMIADAEITDGFTIAAYTRAKLKGLLE
ncbi:MAG: NUDIX hydrolase [Anaerolineae bacterium]